MKRKLLLSICSALCVAIMYGQEDSAFVQRIANQCAYDGYKLIAFYKHGDSLEKAGSCSYNLSFLLSASDQVKLMLIGELLRYQDDTALCSVDVINYLFNGMEGCGGHPDSVKRYTLQVDALFMINRLVWPKLMEQYSCSPVLYDTLCHQTIDDQPEKIKCLFEDYKKWYAACLQKGQLTRYFPFNAGRYIWMGGRKSIAPREDWY